MEGQKLKEQEGCTVPWAATRDLHHARASPDHSHLSGHFGHKQQNPPLASG